jgi:CubicO group peptidase (beta-lactamase class C family)
VYSNVSYSILAEALSRASGRKLDDYIQREILDPLGMSNTHFAAKKVAPGRLAKGYYVAVGIDPEIFTELSNTSGGVAEYKPLVRAILETLNPASRGGTGQPIREEH